MKKNYFNKLRFIDKGEKTRFIELASSINARRLLLFLIISIVAEIYFIFSDITSASVETEDSQWYYLYSLLSIVSIISIIFVFVFFLLYKKHPKRYGRTFNLCIHVFCSIILLTSIGDVLLSCIAFSYAEFILYFFSIMLQFNTKLAHKITLIYAGKQISPRLTNTINVPSQMTIQGSSRSIIIVKLHVFHYSSSSKL